eukprot:TRINITY_DN16493_c0_g1_i1.p1 TRINITY_DN16493_c0_g1~~TRINITY_DN16493_c0_g1_i1.p1  ORF type:complete len:221 (+),score=76.30 TRINITY_DN16493_c0_g1_i1:64-663(+)
MSEEEAAASKIQALQRGRLARQGAKEKKEAECKEGPFVRPFEQETEEGALVVLRKPGVVQQFGTLEKLVEALQCSVPNRQIRADQIYYSTTGHPDTFGSLLTEEKFNQVKQHNEMQIDASKQELLLKKSEGATIDEEGEDGQKKTKAQLAKEEKAKQREVRRLQNELQMLKYNISLLVAKLANFYKLHALKVQFIGGGA